MSLDDFTQSEWQRTFAAADEDIIQRVSVSDSSRWRTGVMREDGIEMRVALLVRIIDGDGYSIQITTPVADIRSWNALVAAAKGSRRELPELATTKTDPFCAEH